MKFIADKKHYNQPVNLERVTGIYISKNPTKSGKYYIKFQIDGANADVFWTYDTIEERNFIFDNYIMPIINFLD